MSLKYLTHLTGSIVTIYFLVSTLYLPCSDAFPSPQRGRELHTQPPRRLSSQSASRSIRYAPDQLFVGEPELQVSFESTAEQATRVIILRNSTCSGVSSDVFNKAHFANATLQSMLPFDLTQPSVDVSDPDAIIAQRGLLSDSNEFIIYWNFAFVADSYRFANPAVAYDEASKNLTAQSSHILSLLIALDSSMANFTFVSKTIGGVFIPIPVSSPTSAPTSAHSGNDGLLQRLNFPIYLDDVYYYIIAGGLVVLFIIFVGACVCACCRRRNKPSGESADAPSYAGDANNIGDMEKGGQLGAVGRQRADRTLEDAEAEQNATLTAEEKLVQLVEPVFLHYFYSSGLSTNINGPYHPGQIWERGSYRMLQAWTRSMQAENTRMRRLLRRPSRADGYQIVCAVSSPGPLTDPDFNALAKYAQGLAIENASLAKCIPSMYLSSSVGSTTPSAFSSRGGGGTRRSVSVANPSVSPTRMTSSSVPTVRAASDQEASTTGNGSARSDTKTEKSPVTADVIRPSGFDDTHISAKTNNDSGNKRSKDIESMSDAGNTVDDAHSVRIPSSFIRRSASFARLSRENRPKTTINVPSRSLLDDREGKSGVGSRKVNFNSDDLHREDAHFNFDSVYIDRSHDDADVAGGHFAVQNPQSRSQSVPRPPLAAPSVHSTGEPRGGTAMKSVAESSDWNDDVSSLDSFEAAVIGIGKRSSDHKTYARKDHGISDVSMNAVQSRELLCSNISQGGPNSARQPYITNTTPTIPAALDGATDPHPASHVTADALVEAASRPPSRLMDRVKSRQHLSIESLAAGSRYMNSPALSFRAVFSRDMESSSSSGEEDEDAGHAQA